MEKIKNSENPFFAYNKEFTDNYVAGCDGVVEIEGAACFESKDESLLRGYVTLLIKDGILKVDNITSYQGCPELKKEEYYHILFSFYLDFIAQHLDETYRINIGVEKLEKYVRWREGEDWKWYNKTNLKWNVVS